ncbi:MAG TPA: pilus assembly PilX N-terminal domain-containing protein [Candidatus Gracilibacteria bacterium]
MLTSKHKSKNQGSVLVMTIIIGFMMLSLALTAVNVLVTDVEVLEDFIAGEQAYFAAESGMEEALMALEDEPVDLVIDKNIIISDTQNVILNIPNQVATPFEFDLPVNTSRKLRLKTDSDIDLRNPTLSPVKDFQIQASEVGGGIFDPTIDRIHWEIACLEDVIDPSRPAFQKKTIALQRLEAATEFEGAGKSLAGLTGNFDAFERQPTSGLPGGASHRSISGTALVSSFLNGGVIPSGGGLLGGLTDPEVQTCFFTITNNADAEVRVVITPTGPMPPDKVIIRSEGQAGGRRKIIEFVRFQTNIGEIFGFTFFHRGG